MKNNKCSDEYNDVTPIQTKTVLSKEQFNELYTFVNIIRPYFNDFCVINGKFRARSNDITCIVETEFSYFKGIDLYISNIQILLNTLSKLNKKAAITILIDDVNVTFSDGYQNIKVLNADPEFIDNKFITDGDMKKILDNNVVETNLFIKEKLPKSVVCNINKITQNFDTYVIKVKHAQDDLSKGYFYISNHEEYNHTNNHDNEYTIKLKERLLMPMKRDLIFYVTTLPFIFNQAEMTLCYYLNTDSSIVTTVHKTTVDGLLVHAFGRSAICEETE